MPPSAFCSLFVHFYHVSLDLKEFFFICDKGSVFVCNDFVFIDFHTQAACVSM